MKSLEDEESKRIGVQISESERKAALILCASMGFTIENTPGTEEVKPKALGMKGVDVDFDAIERADKPGDIRLKQPKTPKKSHRVDLSTAAGEATAEYVSTMSQKVENDEEFIKFDVGHGQDFQTLNYNHKLRRKLRRAIDNAQAQKEILVRERTIEYLKERVEEVPSILLTPLKPLNVKGHRILDNGKLETAKQERVRARMELAEFNLQMKVLRRQAKEVAVYAGLKKYAILTGRLKDTEDFMDAGDDSNNDPLHDVSIQTHDRPRKRSLSESVDSSRDKEHTGEESQDNNSTSETDPDSTSSHPSVGDEHIGKRRK